MFMPTKLGWAKTYNKVLPPIKSCDHLITLSSQITWQTKFIIPVLPQSL